MKYTPEDNILSNRSKKNKKQADEKMYFENTHDVLGLYKNPKLANIEEEEEEDETEKNRPKGFALLNRIYNPCWKGYEQFGMKVKDGKSVPNCIPIANNSKKGSGKHSVKLTDVSNPRQVQAKAFKVFGKDAVVYISDKPTKKYKILNPTTGKFVYFGDAKMEDYTKHKDKERRRRYIARASNIKGNWRNDPYSPNNLSLILLWDA